MTYWVKIDTPDLDYKYLPVNHIRCIDRTPYSQSSAIIFNVERGQSFRMEVPPYKTKEILEQFQVDGWPYDGIRPDVYIQKYPFNQFIRFYDRVDRLVHISEVDVSGDRCFTWSGGKRIYSSIEYNMIWLRQIQQYCNRDYQVIFDQDYDLPDELEGDRMLDLVGIIEHSQIVLPRSTSSCKCAIL